MRSKRPRKIYGKAIIKQKEYQIKHIVLNTMNNIRTVIQKR